jgi:hypothetical protein
MQDTTRHRIKVALRCISLVASIGLDSAFAQSGSAGGNIGNDEKSLSGSRQTTPRSTAPERPARQSRPEAGDTHRSTPRTSGGAGGNFDGAWTVVSVGTTCSGGSTTAVVVSSGKIIGQGVSGTVSASGSASAVGNSNGVTIVSSGHLSARSGSGSFRQSDGCSGRWSASKQ